MRETKRCVRWDSCDGQQSPSFLLRLEHFNFCIVYLWRKEGGEGGKKGRRKKGRTERERNRRKKVGSQTHSLKLLIIAVLSTGAPRATANKMKNWQKKLQREGVMSGQCLAYHSIINSLLRQFSPQASARSSISGEKSHDSHMIVTWPPRNPTVATYLDQIDSHTASVLLSYPVM